MKSKLLSGIACLLLGSAAMYAQVTHDSGLKPTGKGWGERSANAPGKAAKKRAGPGSTGISYHGGPVMTSGPTVYFIWYGNWSGNTATTILPYMIQNEGGSSYFNINTSS